MKYREELKFALECAREAGSTLLNGLDSFQILRYKDRRDIVTDIDVKIEKRVVRSIKKRFPDHGVIAEEKTKFGSNKKDFFWVIDPIDGTKHFVKNFPIFSFSIALFHRRTQRPVVGAVYSPVMDHLFYASEGGGSYLNNVKLEVSKVKDLRDSFIFLDTPKLSDLSPKERKIAIKRFNALISNTYRLRALGCGSLMLCYLASGAFDGYVDITGYVKLVDVAAGILIVKEAGGRVTDLNAMSYTQNTEQFIATNGIIHEELLKLLG